MPVATSIQEELVAILDEFCQQRLNKEYAQVCREVVAALASQRNSPLHRGKPQLWAAGIVSAVGSVNFLDDKSQTPHMRLGDIGPALGVSASGTSARAREIRETLAMGPFDPRWTLPTRQLENPVSWLIQVNGFVLDARQAPRPVQEEAHRLGLIPFVPA